MTPDRFEDEFERPNVPVIIEGATRDWPAVRRWDRAYLSEQTRGETFRATSGAAPLPANFTVDRYARYCDAAVEEAPLYLFDRTFADRCPRLSEDYSEALAESCPYLDPSSSRGHDLLSALGPRRRPDHRWLIMGPMRSGSAFHIDPNATHAWNAPVRGRKRWIFYPPGVPPPGVLPSPNGDDVAMPVSLGEWFLTYWDAHASRMSDPDPSRRPLECTVCPGDLLFVPHGWWHAVLNLDRGISVALTQNYVSRTNLGDVLRFLDRRPGQISGCRDREGEAVPPERLGEEFRRALGERRPDLLEMGEREAKRGWGCKAWTDGSEGEWAIDEEVDEAAVDIRAGPGTSVLDRARMLSHPKTTIDANAAHEVEDEVGKNCGNGEIREGASPIEGGGGFSFSFL